MGHVIGFCPRKKTHSQAQPADFFLAMGIETASSRRSCCGVPLPKSTIILGYICLTAVVLQWVASGFVAQTVFTTFNYQSTVAQTVYNLCFYSVLLIPHIVTHQRRKRSDINEEGVSAIDYVLANKLKVLGLGCIWLSAQVVYVMSLLYSSMGKNTAVSSSSSAFSFVFSILILGYEFRIVSALGVLGTIGGVVMTSLFRPDEIIDPSNTDTFEIVDSAQGYIMAVSAAVCFGLFSCLFKKWIKEDKYGGVVFGSFGLISLVIGLPLVLICHYTGLQTVAAPGWQAALLITADAILCCFVNNFCLSRAFIYLTPVVVLVGLSMTTPLSIFVDVVILGKTAYSTLNVVGVCLIILAVLVVGYDQNIYEKKLDGMKQQSTPREPIKEDSSAATTDSGPFSAE